jgi:hypothetical protein
MQRSATTRARQSVSSDAAEKVCHWAIRAPVKGRQRNRRPDFPAHPPSKLLLLDPKCTARHVIRRQRAADNLRRRDEGSRSARRATGARRRAMQAAYGRLLAHHSASTRRRPAARRAQRKRGADVDAADRRWWCNDRRGRRRQTCGTRLWAGPAKHPLSRDRPRGIDNGRCSGSAEGLQRGWPQRLGCRRLSEHRAGRAGAGPSPG